MREAFEDDVAESADDAALIARAIAGATKRLETEKAPPAPVVRLAPRAGTRRAARKWLRFAIPLAAAFAASVALAAFAVSRREAPPHRDEPAHLQVPTAPATTPTGATLPTPTPETTASISVSDLPNARVATSASAPAPPRIESSAADLFRDANQERRSGDVGKAVTLYRTLLDRHPDSPEAQASHVSLGRLLLDRRGDATGALAEFDAYLKGSAKDGALAEEARLGRALALEKLGQKAEERKAWEELLARHPQSLHAGRARERLDALGTP